ncbi:MAG TPA: hypothetical protein VFT43_04955, partial [Candidatus Polarisedimenticolia bacterium]|nr:hypothetical protein [Candidatus Polarisedimenticolia bacterium]
ERIALGIDLPELDTVPLWSVRRQDGSMSIPFIEFILGQIGDSLESFCGTVETAPPQAIEKLMEDRRAVAGMLEETAPAGEPLPLLPRLKDVFVPESLLERLYKADGMFEEIARRCVAVLIATREGPGH